MPLNHIGIPVSDVARSKAFYEAALKPLGMGVTMEFGSDAVGFGAEGDSGLFWISGSNAVGEGVHVAFDAATREEVDEFHRAALAAGGRDNGAPGLRPNYAPNYYAAFAFDPDGANIEAVCMLPD